MVKNTTGGSSHKSVARKFVSSGKSALRLSENDQEQYAIVTKLLGNGMCMVTTSNGLSLLCHIRGKFRSRNKKNNVVANSSIILAGMRDWESSPKNCDLLDVYDADEISQLRNNPKINISKFDSQLKADPTSDVEFTNEAVMPTESTNTTYGMLLSEMLEMESVSIDDI